MYFEIVSEKSVIVVRFIVDFNKISWNFCHCSVNYRIESCFPEICTYQFRKLHNIF
jgi:hypothetical protein